LMPGASQTAFGVGMLRALHRIVDAEPWVVDDTISLALFGDAVRAILRKDPGWFQDERGTVLRAHVLVRSAFAEDRLRAAVARSVRQCVVLGAGYDTFAYRQPQWMRDVQVFELDAAPTRADKLERLARAGIAPPANVAYAALDLERASLADVLRSAGFDAASPAFFSWLGVMVYLSGAAVDAVFRSVAALPTGSEIAFTFTPPGGDEALARKVADVGEPLRTRIDPAMLDPMLYGFGFHGVKQLTIDEARAFLGERSDALRLSSRESIATALL